MFKVKVCLLMLLCSVAAAMANPPVPVEKVKGTIKTPNGEPVIGATIIEKGTTNGTITDVNGNFVLKIMNKIGELEAACVGFKKVVFKPEKEIVSLIMEEDTKVLGEVVVLPWVSPARLNHWDIRYRSWEVTEWCKRTNPIL